MLEVCNIFALLGARGTSVLINLGDHSIEKAKCANNKDSATAMFLPYFAAECPFVATVNGKSYINPEC
jgi:tripeptidyl-peptidase-1